MSELPAGFTLDDPKMMLAPAAPTPAGLPEGYTLDEAPASPAAKPKRGLGQLLMDETWIGKALTDFGKAAIAPGRVYSGELDPNSEEALGAMLTMGATLSPMSPANGTGAAVAARAGLGKPAVEVIAPQAVQAAPEMGVTLTAGQRSGNPALLSRENAMLGGGLGESAQKVAQEAAARQQQELFSARSLIGDVAGRGAPALERPAEAGGMITDAVKAAQQTAKEGFQAKYKQAFSGEGSFPRQVFEGSAESAPISKRIVDTLARGESPILIDETLTPIANRAVTELEKISQLQLSRTGQPAMDEITGVNLRGVDQARKKLVAYYNAAKSAPRMSADPTPDMRAMQGVMKQFDQEIAGAVENGLFSGDEKFLKTLKEASGDFANYAKTFRQQGGGDDVGRALRSIIERDATPEQTINYLLGHSKVGNTPLSVRMADRMKNILGSDSPEWSALRQAAWQRTTGVAEGQTEMGAQKMSERIYDLTNGSGRSLATRLFSPDEIKQMNSYASILKATVGKPGTTNAPNSGNRTMALARQMSGAIGAMVGAGGGGIVGAGVGAGVGKGAGMASDALAAREARALFSGREPVSIGAKLANGLKSTGSRVALPGALEAIGSSRR